MAIWPDQSGGGVIVKTPYTLIDASLALLNALAADGVPDAQAERAALVDALILSLFDTDKAYIRRSEKPYRPLYNRRSRRLVSSQGLDNPTTTRLHTVNSEFFTSIGFTPMGGMVRLYKTRKGKAARLRCEVINIPPARLITGQSHNGVRQMNATTRASAQSATSSTINARLDTSNVLFELWERTAPTLNKSELEWFAGASDHAEQIVGNLRHVIEGVGCLVASDELRGKGQPRAGSFQEAPDVATLLYSIEQQLDTVQGLMNVGLSAGYRLRHPEQYSQIGGVK